MTKKPATKVIRIPLNKRIAVSEMLGHEIGANQQPRVNVTLTNDEALICEHALGRNLFKAEKLFLSVRVPAKDVDKIRKAMRK